MTKTVNAPTQPAQIRLTRRSPAYWRVTIDNPPINVMGPDMVQQFQEVINALETDEHVRRACHSGPDFLVRLTHVPVVSIALIRGRATGNGSELTLACDMSFASREKAILSQ
jgi:enoyl-CoA hydratase/carnithine racemase